MRSIPSLLLLCSALFQPVQAQQGSYARFDFPQRISIEVPADWKVSAQANRSNLAAAARTMMDSAGQEGSTGKKETLLAVSSPAPAGAMVRLSVTTPPEYSQADLAAATPSDLKELEDALLKQYRRLEGSGGPKVVQMLPARFDTVGGRRALVISYRRSSPAGPSPWQVVQYKIPLSDGLIELTLSHRESDAAMWRPVLEKVKRSVALPANGQTTMPLPPPSEWVGPFPVPSGATQDPKQGGMTSMAPGRNYVVTVYTIERPRDEIVRFYESTLKNHQRSEGPDGAVTLKTDKGSVRLTGSGPRTRIQLTHGPQ